MSWVHDDALLATFRTEVGERISSLQAGLLALENDPTDTEVMAAIFRDAHTIKGSAKMMGFSAIKELAHRMEDVLGDVKEGLLPLEPALADVLLQSADAILGLLAEDRDPDELTAEGADLIGKLQASRGLGSGGGQSASQGAAPPPEPAPAPAGAVPAGGGSGAARIPDIPTSPPRPATGPPAPPSSAPAAPASSPAAASAASAASAGPAPKGGAPASPAAADTALDVLAAEAEQPDAGPGGNGGGRTESFVNPIGQSIRIEATKLYELIDLVGEVVIGQVRLEEISRAMNDATRSLEGRARRMRRGEDVTEASGLLAEMRERVGMLSSQLVETVGGQSRGLDRLQEQAMRMAMLPTASIFAPYPRLVRNLCRELGREVDLHLDGGGTELDKQVLEQIVDPIRHLLINAVDHGIETPDERERQGKPRRGSLRVTARQQGRQVVIDVADDGKGIDPERVREIATRKGLIDEGDELSSQEVLSLLFRPGFSTTTRVTDVSGRGVGLDVVKDAVDRLKGNVDIDSAPGAGTRFSITLPITLAIVEAVLVSAGGQEFAIPVSAVEEVVAVPKHEVRNVGGREAVVLREKTTPLVPLHGVLMLPEDEIDDGPVVVVATATRRLAMRVGELIGQQEVVIKGLGAFLPRMKHVAGASILGDGRVVLVLDPYELIESARRPVMAGGSHALPKARARVKEHRAPRILIAEDSLAIREMLRAIFEAAGYRVETAVDGADAIDKLQGGGFAGVITDLEMPRVDGFELTRKIRLQPETEALPVIMVTTLAKEEDRRRGLECGANAYIVKSAFDQTRLLETIRSLVGS